jgi:hypothetical protein
MNPARFERVAWDTFEENACTPALPPGFRGIVLDGPRTVTLADDAPLPVAGVYRVTARFMSRFESMDAEIVVVATDARTHEARSTQLIHPEADAVPAAFDPNDPDLDTTIYTGWFNLDLFHWLTDLPRRAARYHVFATVGDVTSNVITVELVEP